MALYHKWDVKTGFTFALQFFMLISDGLGGVASYQLVPDPDSGCLYEIWLKISWLLASVEVPQKTWLLIHTYKKKSIYVADFISLNQKNYTTETTILDRCYTLFDVPVCMSMPNRLLFCLHICIAILSNRDFLMQHFFTCIYCVCFFLLVSMQ